MTADLRVRYRLPVLVGEALAVRAWLVSSRHGLFELEAELTQGGSIRAVARGKFIRRHE